MVIAALALKKAGSSAVFKDGIEDWIEFPR